MPSYAITFFMEKIISYNLCENMEIRPWADIGKCLLKNYSVAQRVFETPFQWTIIRNVSCKKCQTSESAELVTTCAAV